MTLAARKRREFVRGKIRDARQRYVKWSVAQCTGAPYSHWLAWRRWRNARLDYFDQQLQLRRPWNEYIDTD